MKRAHYLREIIDPLGRVGARSEYDENGRLKQIVDVNGKSVDMTYDTANDKQVVKDQLGNQTTYFYDDRGNVLREIDAEGKITDRTYDDNNWTLSETVISDRSDNPNTTALEGFTTTYTYDTQGNKLTETDALGHTMYYTYGAKSRLLTETDAIGRTTTNRYDNRGNLVETIDSNKKSSSYAYDDLGQLKSVKDAHGKESFFDYDERGEVSQVRNSLGDVIDYTYNLRGDQLTETRYRKRADGTTESLLTTWTYDNEGRMKTKTDAESHTTRYDYDKQGRQTTMTDFLSRKSELIYNEKGQMVSSIAPDATPNNPNDNPRTGSRYDDAGRKIADIDQLGRETRYIYDKVGRLVETIHPDSTSEDWNDNARVKTEYFTDGLVKARIDERGNRTEFLYDAVGRQIAVFAADKTPNTLSDNPTTRYVYDKAGQQRSMTDALGHTTTYEYDDLGRRVKTIYDDLSFTSQDYDDLGRRIASLDQNGKRTEYRYDDLGRLTGVKNALLDWTIYTYNEMGQMVSMTDAELHTTRYEYDKLGRRSATILPLNQRSGMTYDEVGNLKMTTDFNGKTIAYRYDEQDRLIEKSFEDGSKVQYGYTRNSLQDTVTFRDSSGLITSFYDYDYDVRDRLTKRTDILSTGITQTTRAIEYGYDAASNQTSVTTASGTTTYSYDERNRLDLVKLNGILQADYDYDAASRLIKTTFGNNTEEVRLYDTLNRLKELTSKRTTDNVLLSKYVYTLDKVGNRKTATETVNGQSRSLAYTYDDLYRLTEEVITDTTNGNRTFGYTYDAVGNRQSKTINGVKTTYTYDANDRLLNEKVNGVITAAYSYDNNGSTLTKTENGVMMTYTWNDEKRMVSVTVGNTQQVGYTYNDQGIRVSSKVNSVETRYLLDEGITANVWEEYSPNGSVQASYMYGCDLITQTQGTQTSYYLVDGLGSTRLLTDTQGQVLNSYGYEAFGEKINQSGSTDNKYQYAGEQFDAVLGNYYLRQRFYDTSSGRFGRMDTYEGALEIPLSLNKYIYTHGNPANSTDPSGLLPAWLAGIFVHQAIGQHFVSESLNSTSSLYGHDLLQNRAISTILRARNPKDVIETFLPRPDLIDLTDQKIYEIKTVRQAAQGAKELKDDYLPHLNKLDPGWDVGIDYVPPSQMNVPAVGLIEINAPTQQGSGYPGVVSYERVSNFNNPSLQFTIEFAIYTFLLLALLAAATRAGRFAPI
jgi:RHS repeat-associated protein